MPANSAQFDVKVLEQLACPACYGPLRMETNGQLICCVDCLRAYPLIDGIPVLIPERMVSMTAK